MKLEKQTEEYWLFITESLEDVCEAQILFETFSNVTLWVSSEGRIDGFKIWDDIINRPICTNWYGENKNIPVIESLD